MEVVDPLHPADETGRGSSGRWGKILLLPWLWVDLLSAVRADWL